MSRGLDYRNDELHHEGASVPVQVSGIDSFRSHVSIQSPRRARERGVESRSSELNRYGFAVGFTDYAML